MVDLTGNWRSFYRYPSSGRGNDEQWGRHELAATQTGNAVEFESVDGSKSHVIITIKLSDGGKTATGTWREETNPEGYYKGAVYDGTIEFTVTADGRRLNGTWHGAGKEGEMNSDIWELVRISPDEKEAD
ncbi:MAG TPA: hypothetical protein VLE99_01135 [Candidatus Saccharimonadales bacterium]|nr:hypothetical protein [Candidatus Saccharimonadales bacterium]